MSPQPTFGQWRAANARSTPVASFFKSGCPLPVSNTLSSLVTTTAPHWINNSSSLAGFPPTRKSLSVLHMKCLSLLQGQKYHVLTRKLLSVKRITKVDVEEKHEVTTVIGTLLGCSCPCVQRRRQLDEASSEDPEDGEGPQEEGLLPRKGVQSEEEGHRRTTEIGTSTALHNSMFFCIPFSISVLPYHLYEGWHMSFGVMSISSPNRAVTGIYLSHAPPQIGLTNMPGEFNFRVPTMHATPNASHCGTMAEEQRTSPHPRSRNR
ncbi:hypothetical protein CDAR_573701 [Caerostris darwini]|uniref:Uncharacterized protein n=1 Tax=Caerostris darwini TaxID=1538125 RepID=A0AAV4MCD4_9ARAC|nr:hypothetical protein CDAR_573701 [Caerostris darwini]